ncbi:MAG: nicotinate (nicotinamide) nucleotide adenylyltransferase [Burkholderiales bacterium PBB5]|nr:MAG: nicotinate (nicotinamide) nucleotide adenylyltransferase [Burkholderiales bacterium PBB5]
MSQRRIGLLGGSFDPPHLAHLALGRVAQQALALDELRWLPAGAPWQKAGRPMTPPQHRRAMLASLLADEPAALIDDTELAHRGPTYTIETVRTLQAAAPGAQWFLIIGQDQYARFDTWRDWPELLQRVTLAVAARAGQAPTPPAALAGHPHRVVVLAMPRLDIAASDIRARARQGLGITDLVGDAVARYIERHRLYTAQPGI